MHADTLKKLQDIGGFVLASGCTKKSLKQVTEMIRAARDYRFIAIYKIVNDEFVILAGTAGLPAFSGYPGIMWRGAGIGKSNCGRRRSEGQALPADVSHDAVGNYRSDEERAPARCRHA